MLALLGRTYAEHIWIYVMPDGVGLWPRRHRRVGRCLTNKCSRRALMARFHSGHWGIMWTIRYEQPAFRTTRDDRVLRESSGRSGRRIGAESARSILRELP